MPFNFQLSEEAEKDIYDSYTCYESQQLNLGEKFLNSLDAARKSITSNPSGYQIRHKKKVRGYFLKDFPYLVLYIIKGNNVDVISVFNTRQHPGKWKERLK
ncbi:MAG: type II toxin-antitoxin system RelE/ParE family toxin [Cyclobacteriaceae bacterium]|nr:type II toxin-antitoxin system RelE/ParE family toxin [Cyclobacteriaceae bacterium]